jgi:hypothetical protein
MIGFNVPKVREEAKRVLPQIQPKWRDSFLHFIETGQGSDDFFNYLDSDESCQTALDMVIDAQAEIFQKLAETLRTHVH